MKTIISILFLMASISLFSQETNRLSVEDAVNKALENNYGIVTVKKSHEINELNNSWGNTGALPTVSFTGMGSESWNYNDNDDYKSTNLSGSVDLNWVLFRGFGARITKQSLEELEKMSEGNLAITVENTIIDVILAYYNILLTEKSMDIAEKNMNLSEDRYEQEKQKKQLGTSVTYDLLQAQNSYLEDKSNYLSAKSSYNNAKRQLNNLMAEALDNEYSYTSSFDIAAKDFVQTDLEAKMLGNNNTLKNQYINLEMAKLDIKSAKSAYYPTIAAGASGSYSNNEMDYETMNNMDNSSSGFNTGLNLSVSYSIYEGETRRRALQAAKIEKEISEIETVDMEQQLKNQLAQEFEFYQVRQELLILAEENLKAAELNLELSKQKYENGSINSFNYRDIQQMYSNVALNYQNAMYNLIQSYHTLLRLTGG
ncbi:MAG: TolC family protein, partial [Bacteroidales bacterium]|nr:TolC family protein [Bacteroidales bacterium]